MQTEKPELGFFLQAGFKKTHPEEAIEDGERTDNNTDRPATVSILKRTALAFGYLNRAANGKNKNEKRDGDNDADE